MYSHHDIDGLVQGIQAILENQRSLSETDVKKLNEAICILEQIQSNECPTAEKQFLLKKAIQMIIRFLAYEVIKKFLDE